MKQRVIPHPLEASCERIAREFHSNDRRIISQGPFIDHPLAVTNTLKALHYGPIIVGSGWVHDCPEDHPDSCPMDELADRIGCPGAERVVNNVRTLTYDQSCPSKHERYERYRLALAKNSEAVPIALADKADNISSDETDLNLGINVFGANYLNCDPREEIEHWLAVVAICLEKRHHDPGVKKLCTRVIALTRSVKATLIAKKFMKPF